MLQMKRLLKAPNIEWLPAQLLDQVTNGLLRGFVLSAVHHHRLDIVLRIIAVFEILEAVDGERFDHLRLWNKLLHHLRSGLNVVETVGEVWADGIGTIDKNLALEFSRNGPEGRLVCLKRDGEENDIGSPDCVSWRKDLEVGIPCQGLLHAL